MAPQPRTVDKKTIHVARKIHAYLLEIQRPLTEAEIRLRIGDNTGTGTALRYFISHYAVKCFRTFN